MEKGIKVYWQKKLPNLKWTQLSYKIFIMYTHIHTNVHVYVCIYMLYILYTQYI